MIIRRTAIRCLLPLTLSMMLFGCGGSGSFADIKAEMKKIQAKPHGTIQPPPEFKPTPTFTYSANRLRAPFTIPKDVEKPVLTGNGKQVEPDMTRPKEYLERFKLDSLQMVGTISRPAAPLQALIRDPEGNVTRVQVGDHMGTNFGEVRKITPITVSVMEIIPDGRDGWVQRPRTISMTTETNQ